MLAFFYAKLNIFFLLLLIKNGLLIPEFEKNCLSDIVVDDKIYYTASNLWAQCAGEILHVQTHNLDSEA